MNKLCNRHEAPAAEQNCNDGDIALRRQRPSSPAASREEMLMSDSEREDGRRAGRLPVGERR
jgi:hypothetical protein